MIPRPPTSTLFPYTTLFRSTATSPTTAAHPTDLRPVESLRGATPTTLPSSSQALVGLGVLFVGRSEEHTSELQSQSNLVCRLLLEKKNMCFNKSHAHDLSFP